MVLMLILAIGFILSNMLRPGFTPIVLLRALSYESMTFLVKLVPVSNLIASLFAINGLKNRNELTAIFASGYSRIRFIFIIIFLSLSVASSLFLVNAYLVPWAKHRQEIEFNQFEDSSIRINTLNSGRIWFKGQNYFMSYASFDPQSESLHNVDLYYFNTNHSISEKVSAKKATFLQEKSWKLSSFERATNLDNDTFPTSTSRENEIWTLNESIGDFKKINAGISTLSIWKLFDYIVTLKKNNLNFSEYFVIFLDKFSSALSCVVFALLSATTMFNPNRRSSSFGKSLSFVLIFTFFYWFIYSYFFTLGQSSRIPPAIATFGVPSLFVIYLVGFFIHHRKLR